MILNMAGDCFRLSILPHRKIFGKNPSGCHFYSIQKVLKSLLVTQLFSLLSFFDGLP